MPIQYAQDKSPLPLEVLYPWEHTQQRPQWGKPNLSALQGNSGISQAPQLTWVPDEGGSCLYVAKKSRNEGQNRHVANLVLRQKDFFDLPLTRKLHWLFQTQQKKTMATWPYHGYSNKADLQAPCPACSGTPDITHRHNLAPMTCLGACFLLKELCGVQTTP